LPPAACTGIMPLSPMQAGVYLFMEEQSTHQLFQRIQTLPD
jgi:hypothetical protein